MQQGESFIKGKTTHFLKLRRFGGEKKINLGYPYQPGLGQPGYPDSFFTRNRFICWI